MYIFLLKQYVIRIGRVVLPALLFLTPLKVAAEQFNLFVQPVQSQEVTEKAFAPLARYLASQTGQEYRVMTTLNFVTYWQRMRRGNEFDLVLDAAHFTDYRIKKMGYEVLAKLPDTVSYSLVTDESTLLFDADELIGKRVATAPSPSLGGVRLTQLYPNILRQPVSVPTNNFSDALNKLRKKAITGALVPTPLVNNDSTVNTVLTTEPVPHMALSASKKLNSDLKDKIRKALLNAYKTPEGQVMLKEINFPRFEATSAREYDGYADMLEEVWGY